MQVLCPRRKLYINLEEKHMFHNWFILKRLHSLSGIFPVGAYLCFHLFVNSFAIGGSENFNTIAHLLESMPYVKLIAFALIWVPILFHSILGLYLWKSGAINVERYGYFSNWLYFLQRLTGGIGFVFIAVHWMQTRGENLFFGEPVNYEMMHEVLENGFFVAFYLIGVLSLVFHFANGVRTFLITWGITVGAKSQRLAFYLSGVIFFVLSFITIATIFAFMVPVSG